MSWEIKVLEEFEHDVTDKIVDEVVDVLEERGEPRDDDGMISDAAYEIVGEVLEGHFVYNVDRLAALQYYGHIEDGFMAAVEDIESDVVEKAVERYCY